jgi:NADPH:quinone reductase-like Zn-dependent oxidoreductase
MAQIKTQAALIITGPGAAEVMHDLTIPSPEYRQVLVKTHAVGLNTPDVLSLDHLGRSGAGFGFDFAGEVVELGEALSESCNIGDRVAGFVHGCM